jgi:hypothetical protein
VATGITTTWSFTSVGAASVTPAGAWAVSALHDRLRRWMRLTGPRDSSLPAASPGAVGHDEHSAIGVFHEIVGHAPVECHV